MSVPYQSEIKQTPFIDESSSSEDKYYDGGNDSPPLDEKNEKQIIGTAPGQSLWTPPANWIQRFLDDYTGEHAGETLPAGSDPERCAYSILTMDETAAVDHLKYVVIEHADDYTFDTAFMGRIKDLILGHSHCGMEYEDWAYTTAKTAGLVYNWSPYAEVRSVTVPYDDMDAPCETIRAYILAALWVCICTAVNTCERTVIRREK